MTVRSIPSSKHEPRKERRYHVKMSAELWQIILSRRPDVFGEACPIVAFSTNNLTQTDWGLIPRLSCKRPATNSFRHNTAKPPETFYVLLTEHLDLILVSDQLDALLT